MFKITFGKGKETQGLKYIYVNVLYIFYGFSDEQNFALQQLCYSKNDPNNRNKYAEQYFILFLFVKRFNRHSRFQNSCVLIIVS